MKRLAVFLAVLLLGSACARREPEWVESHEQGVSSSGQVSVSQGKTTKRLEKDVNDILIVQFQNEGKTIPVLQAEDTEEYAKLLSEAELSPWSGPAPAENSPKIIYTLKTGKEIELVTLYFSDELIFCKYSSESKNEMKYECVEISSPSMDFKKNWHEVSDQYREFVKYESNQNGPVPLAGEGFELFLKNLSQNIVAAGYRILDYSVHDVRALEKCREGLLCEARFDVKPATGSFAGILAGEDGWIRDLCWRLWIRKGGSWYTIEEMGEADAGGSVDWEADIRYAREHMPDDFQLYTLFGDSDALSDAPAPADLSHSNVYQGENCVELVDFATGKITHRLSYPEGYADYLGLWEGTLIFGNGRGAAGFDGTLQELWRVEVADYEVLKGQAVINWDTLQAYDIDDRGIRAQDLITGEAWQLAFHINDSPRDFMGVSLETNCYSRLWLIDHGRILVADQQGYEWSWGYTFFDLSAGTQWEIPLRIGYGTCLWECDTSIFAYEYNDEAPYGTIYDIRTGTSRQIEISRIKAGWYYKYAQYGGAAVYGDDVYIFLYEGGAWNLVRMSLRDGELTDCGISIAGASPDIMETPKDSVYPVVLYISEDGWLLVRLEENRQELCYGAVRLSAVSETAESL